jgi:hypothetical protein
MPIVISAKIREKLASKHGVSPDEVSQCFANRIGKFLTDNREEHASDPPTLWFISETDWGKSLKIVFVRKGDKIYLRTAFPPNAEEVRIYKKYGGDAT